MSELLANVFKSTEFWSTIIGAIVGGGIAFCVQLVALRDARLVRENERKGRAEALANALMFKLVKIHSLTNAIKRHFDESKATADADGFEGEPWQIYVSIANPPEPISFSSEEMALVLSLKDDDIFNKLMNIDNCHSALLSAVSAFNRSRGGLEESLAAMTTIVDEQGQQVSHAILGKDISHVRPRMIEVNGLAQSLMLATNQELARCDSVLPALNQLLREKCGIAYKVESAPPKGTSSSNA